MGSTETTWNDDTERGKRTRFAPVWIVLASGVLLACAGGSSSRGAASAKAPAPIEEFLPELSNLDVCRNAVDDDDSGFIDDGCDEGRAGRVEFYLAWPDAALSLDLRVTGPEGGLAEVGRETKEGLVKLVDCPGEAVCDGQNFEKVVVNPAREIAFGKYRIEIEVNGDFPDARDYSFTMGVVDRRVTRAYRGKLGPLDRRAEVTLEFFADGRPPATSFPAPPSREPIFLHRE